MEMNSTVVSRSLLFTGMTEQEFSDTLACLSPVCRSYARNEIIWHGGETVDAVGMTVSGRVHIVQEDFLGNRSILDDAGPGDLFGDAYACLPDEKLRVTVMMAEPGAVLFIGIQKLLKACAKNCERHAMLIRNLAMATARKNLSLTRKLSVLAKRSIREKLIAYLSSQSLLSGSASFTIPYNRQELADYLCVDRCALSKELCKLRDEGVITFRMNCFSLTDIHAHLWNEQ